MQGFWQAAGDVIFCADQDDVWHKDKLEKMTAVLEQHPEVRVLACNIHPFYEEERSWCRWAATRPTTGTHPLEKVVLDKMWLEPWRGPAVPCLPAGASAAAGSNPGSRLVPMICCCGQWGLP